MLNKIIFESFLLPLHLIMTKINLSKSTVAFEMCGLLSTLFTCWFYYKKGKGRTIHLLVFLLSIELQNYNNQ